MKVSHFGLTTRYEAQDCWAFEALVELPLSSTIALIFPNSPL